MGVQCNACHGFGGSASVLVADTAIFRNARLISHEESTLVGMGPRGVVEVFVQGVLEFVVLACVSNAQ